jgi:hypothetical protein
MQTSYWVRFIRDGYHLREKVIASSESEARTTFRQANPDLSIVSVYRNMEQG